jgi:hypothetical protein
MNAATTRAAKCRENSEKPGWSHGTCEIAGVKKRRTIATRVIEVMAQTIGITGAARHYGLNVLTSKSPQWKRSNCHFSFGR